MQESDECDEDSQEAKLAETLVSTVFYSLCMCVYTCKYKIPPVSRNQPHLEIYMSPHLHPLLHHSSYGTSVSLSSELHTMENLCPLLLVLVPYFSSLFIGTH